MKSTPKNEMGDLIRATFRKSGLSIKQLADGSGVPYASVHGVVSGTRDPALSTAARLAKVLGLELRPVRRRKKR
ncbi:MAG: helix-turn-helix domain-containing protein [Planctomycetota bacterium]|jgi:plasmid maintenance system antidote protein VapI